MRAKQLHYLLKPVRQRPVTESPQSSAPERKDTWRGLRQGLPYAGPLLLMLGVTVLLLLTSPSQSLMAFDEGIYAQQARWMQLKGDWVTVGWWGVPGFDRAVGFSWLLALSMHWFGEGEGAVRLPSMVACWGAVLLTWRLGRPLSASGALWGGATLAVLPLWMQASKLGIPAVVFSGLSLALIWALLRSETVSCRRTLWGMGIGLLLNAGFLVGGARGLLLLGSLAPYLILSRRRHRHLANPGIYWGLGLGLVPFAIWLTTGMTRYGSLTVRQMLRLPWGNLSSAVPGVGNHPLEGQTSVLHYLWHLPLVTFPWIVPALLGGALIWRNSLIQRKALWLGYPLVYLVLLSLIGPRSASMALPVYPFLALWAGVGIDHLTRLFCSPRPRHYRLAVGFGWVLGVLAILLISAGGSLLLAPGKLVPQDITFYGWLGLTVGLAWLMPWLVTLNRPRWAPSRQVSRWVGSLWQIGWMLGPTFAIAMLYLTGLWGNYSPAVKTALQAPPIAPVLDQHTVHFIQPRQEREDILLSFYTPHLGERHSNWQDLPPGAYAWGNSQMLPLPGVEYQVIGEVDEWQLVRAPEMGDSTGAQTPPETRVSLSPG